MNTDFLNYILAKYATNESIIYITDSQARILASTDEKRVGNKSRTALYITQVMRPSTIENIGDSEDVASNIVTYGTPVFFEKKLFGIIIVQDSGKNAIQRGNTIKSSLETALEYEKYRQSINNITDDIGIIVKQLLSDKIDIDKVTVMMNNHEMDPNLLRTV